MCRAGAWAARGARGAQLGARLLPGAAGVYFLLPTSCFLHPTSNFRLPTSWCRGCVHEHAHGRAHRHAHAMRVRGHGHVHGCVRRRVWGHVRGHMHIVRELTCSGCMCIRAEEQRRRGGESRHQPCVAPTPTRAPAPSRTALRSPHHPSSPSGPFCFARSLPHTVVFCLAFCSPTPLSLAIRRRCTASPGDRHQPATATSAEGGRW